MDKIDKETLALYEAVYNEQSEMAIKTRKEFGLQCRIARKIHGIRLIDVAQATNTTVGLVSLFERGMNKNSNIFLYYENLLTYKK